MNSMSQEEKIVELQTKLAYQEEALNKLSDEFYQQQKQIQTLEVQQRALLEKIRDLQNTKEPGITNIVDEKPPHY